MSDIVGSMGVDAAGDGDGWSCVGNCGMMLPSGTGLRGPPELEHQAMYLDPKLDAGGAYLLLRLVRGRA